MSDTADPIDKLLTELHHWAQCYDNHEYGLPIHDPATKEHLRGCVIAYRDIVIGQEQARMRTLWTKTLPEPGVRVMYTPDRGMVRVRLVMGGFDGTTPFIFAEGATEPQPLPEGVEWALGPKGS